MPKAKPAWAAVNIVGPDGILVTKDQPIPEKWADDYVAELVASGGATYDEPAGEG